jgi:hypothetical protein
MSSDASQDNAGTHQAIKSGAGDGNRTHGSSLGSLGITIIRRPRNSDSSRPRERMANPWDRKAEGARLGAFPLTLHQSMRSFLLESLPPRAQEQ